MPALARATIDATHSTRVDRIRPPHESTACGCDGNAGEALRDLGRGRRVGGGPVQQLRDRRVVTELRGRDLGGPREGAPLGAAGRGRGQLGPRRLERDVAGRDGLREVARESEPVVEQRGFVDAHVGRLLRCPLPG